ncbi:uncharacterized protein SAMN04488505_102458 [Chitinophaga rupis]|uniref:TPM domain-containing protein n=1 Tax=Chitinophaga rupis TaxID=573321 RepID=A0A1H7QVG6_9BACT|nr:TPM domain-containing protein [Chitinophaga rupis]SEL52001.1 uncharacterized protein SAMN04488505_102458 [Chitinophaga rupis]
MFLTNRSRYFSLYCLLIMLLAAGAATAQQFSVAKVPDPMLQGSHVSNPDQLITPAAEQALNQLLDSLDHSGRAQVAVVLLKTIGNNVPKDVAHELFSTWKPGAVEKNNGLVVLLVDDQHRIEFETGYGLEGDLPDVVCFRIQQQVMLPHFKQQDYDAGMLQGMQAVVSVLQQQDGNGAQTDPAALFAQPEENTRQLPGKFSAFLVIGCFLLGNAGFLMMFHQRKSPAVIAGITKVPDLYRPGWLAWIWLFVTPLVLIFYLVNYTSWSFGFPTVALILYLDWVLFFCAYAVIVRLKAARRLKNSDRHESYLTWKTAEKSLLLSVLFPVPMFFYSRWLQRRLYQLRSTPYQCSSCNKDMKRLSEKADDQFLEKYQVIEEKLHSVDYDVWQCKDCHTQQILAYDIESAKATVCPQCHHKTLTAGKREVQQAATINNAGWGLQLFACDACGYKNKEKYNIPAISTSSSSSSSSGISFGSSSSDSSSSSGSWGGGSSGGGGAGSSW